MKAMVRLLAFGLTYLCVATILAQGVGLAYLSGTGRLDREKWFQILAVVQGIDLAAIQAEHAAAEPVDTEDVSFEQIVRTRAVESLDLSLREEALRNGMTELGNLETQLQNDRKRYDMLRNSFEQRLAALQAGAKDSAIIEVQQILESLKPSQSKDQILRMLDQDEMISVVTILKTMSQDKRKKILDEFKTDEEAKQLGEILENLRKGVPQVDLIRDTREQLRQFTPDQS